MTRSHRLFLTILAVVACSVVFLPGSSRASSDGVPTPQSLGKAILLKSRQHMLSSPSFRYQIIDKARSQGTPGAVWHLVGTRVCSRDRLSPRHPLTYLAHELDTGNVKDRLRWETSATVRVGSRTATELG